LYPKITISNIPIAAIVASLLMVVPSAVAATVPFTETFNTDSADWFDSPGTTPLFWNAVGGPDGSGFAATTGNFMALGTGDPLVLFRAHDEFNSSGGAFVSNWVADGVTGFSASIRHDAGVPLNFFVRFAGPANFPGANNVFFIPVPSGSWTELTAALPNPNLIFEGPFTYEQVFGNIGHVQIGVSTPESLAGLDASFNFDLDNVSIVPEPAALTLLVLGAAVMLKRRSTRRLPSA